MLIEAKVKEVYNVAETNGSKKLEEISQLIYISNENISVYGFA